MSQVLVRRAVLAFALIAMAASCDRLLSADRRIERAAEAYAEGRYLAAMDDVKTALEAEPGHVDGRVLLARVSLRLGDADTARKELDRAIEAGADPAALRDLHYDIFVAQGRYRDALIAAAADEDLARRYAEAESRYSAGDYRTANSAFLLVKDLADRALGYAA